MLIDFIRQIHAAKQFSIKDDFKFLDFEDISIEGIKKNEIDSDVMEIWAGVKIFYDGTLPESYKVLNLMIGDWVEKNTQALSDVIHEKLKQHFNENYPGSDVSDLDDALDSAVIWADQLEYMPVINQEEKSMVIEIELVLDVELLEE